MIRKLLFIGFFSFLVFTSCKKGNKVQGSNKADAEEKSNYVTFSGEIAHPNSDSLMVYKRNPRYKKRIAVSNGKFNDTLHIKEKGDYVLYDGAEQSTIYLEKGYNIHLNMDAKQFDETIKYKGKGSEANNYLAQFFLMKEKTSKDLDEYKTLNEEEISQKIAGIRTEFSEHLHKYKNLDSSFVANQKKAINSSVDDLMLQVIFTRNNKLFEDFSSYKNLSDAKVFEKIENIRAKFLSTLDKYNTLDSVSRDNYKKQMNDFMYYYKHKIEDGLMMLKANKGISPLFTDYENIDGSKTSLKDLRGKYVYIDVWATWCGPCKHELPYLKELQQKYKGRNITFVSISVDDLKDHDKWVKMVKDEKLGGVQLLAKNSWKSNFISNYNIHGIPRFILIDPQGKIVSPDTYRPSDKENIEAFFTSLNI